jgi:hypothetical protein
MLALILGLNFYQVGFHQHTINNINIIKRSSRDGLFLFMQKILTFLKFTFNLSLL